MPRISTVKVEPFDSTQGIAPGETLEITRFYRSDIARAVEADHPCFDDSTCDIAAALGLDLPLWAASMLSSATECAHLDATVWAHRFNRTLTPENDPLRDYYSTEDWEPWRRWFDAHAVMCPDCGGATFGTDHWTPEECGHCGAAYLTDDDKAEFLKGYIEAALWSSHVGDFPGKAPDVASDVSLESYGFTVAHIAPDAFAAMEWDCGEFLAGALHDILRYRAHHTLEQAGHDFWLTRNGHGAGFWDRGLGELGDRLTAESKPYGESDLYVGDDGKVWVA